MNAPCQWHSSCSQQQLTQNLISWQFLNFYNFTNKNHDGNDDNQEEHTETIATNIEKYVWFI